MVTQALTDRSNVRAGWCLMLEPSVELWSCGAVELWTHLCHCAHCLSVQLWAWERLENTARALARSETWVPGYKTVVNLTSTTTTCNLLYISNSGRISLASPSSISTQIAILSVYKLADCLEAILPLLCYQRKNFSAFSAKYRETIFDIVLFLFMIIVENCIIHMLWQRTNVLH